MQIESDEELRTICREIVACGWSEAEWAQRESSDMFQLGAYCGGFDATEGAFCFEVQLDGVEYWFQFGLDEARRVSVGDYVRFEAREAS